MDSSAPVAGLAPAALDPRRWWALALLCGAFFMVLLDGTITIVALPSIGADLGFARQDLPWVLSAYALTFGGLLLLGGRAADLLGRRRVFIGGVLEGSEHPVAVHLQLTAVRLGQLTERVAVPGPRPRHHVGCHRHHHHLLPAPRGTSNRYGHRPGGELGGRRAPSSPAWRGLHQR